MSLRFKLSMSYLVIVGLVVIVGVIAFVTSRKLRVQVSELSRHSGFMLDDRSPLGLVLEVEGEWEDGAFVAEELEELPGPRRPKLRGPVGEVDVATGVVRMYGIAMMTDSTTEFEHIGSLADLRAGERAEISARVDEGGTWYARKIRVGDIKDSNKIKGVVNSYQADGVWPDTLEVTGIPVLVGRENQWRGEPSRLHRVERATEAGQIARRVLGSLERVPPDSMSWDVAAIRDEVDDLARLVNDPTSMADTGGSSNESLLLLAAKARALAESPGPGGRALVAADMRSILTERVIPDTDARLLDAQDEFAEEIRETVVGTERTVKLVLGVSLGAVLMGVLLAGYMWRSISRPIASLSEAATRIGEGHLDTRVTATTNDELGVLASSFNQMAEALAASTVSIDNLNAVREKLRVSLSEKELLLREVHHRVKNNLQIVSSLLDLQAGRAADPYVHELFAESRSRIRAMALVHEQFHQSSASDRINLGSYIRLLVAGLAQSLAPARGNLDVRIQADDLHLDIDRAISCGLVVNELVTNAIKHALSSGGGNVVVTVGRCPDGLCELVVCDDGPGMGPAGRDGSLGLDLVEALAGQLGGRAEMVGGKGTEIRVVFPEALREAERA
ncbi:MAG: HAMP domain-containing protein [Candidatus Krumholzibacteria bacterium]|nr:HAMP domain-containing protein [Candidatus Krumholzibacteria bacterium]MDH4337696.1 HAMP domain-containing protein [Candidatus Krumholzibacteria bacterium]MDH5269865.1 HAMP domain-containing protein [Candidatus Krumholzibacteria bacterium]MDH5628253.1 HAMP domain-containing protein [Candidatus Krumholzibacteria bacterium]